MSPWSVPLLLFKPAVQLEPCDFQCTTLVVHFEKLQSFAISVVCVEEAVGVLSAVTVQSCCSVAASKHHRRRRAAVGSIFGCC